MATKRNPLYIKYEKIFRQIRKDLSAMYDKNYTTPIMHRHITGLMELISFQFADLKKILKQIEEEEKQKLFAKANRSQLSAARPGTKPVRRTTKKPKLAERKNVVTFPDGFEFKKVSPAYAKKNYKTQMIYGLEPVKGIEGLIDNIDDFNYWQSATNIFGKEY